MRVTEQNWEDCKKYYLGTYCKFKQTGDELWKIEKVQPDRFYCQNLNGETAFIEYRDGYDIDFVLPKRATFQYGKYAIQLSRIPQRMWKKGIHKENTKFSLLGANHWEDTLFSVDFLNGYVNKPTYFSLEQALKEFQLDSSYMSCALSSRMSISRNLNLFVDTVKIGCISDNLLKVKKVFISDFEKLTSSSFQNLEVVGI